MWQALPPNLLRRCFAAVFPPPAEPAPLLDQGRQWFALQLTCKAWEAALTEDVPVSAEDSPVKVAVEACLPPKSAHAWLAAHTAALYLRPMEEYEFFQEWTRQHGPIGDDPDPSDELILAECSWRHDWVVSRCGLPHAEAMYRMAPRPDAAGQRWKGALQHWALDLSDVSTYGFSCDLLDLLSCGDWVGRQGLSHASEEPSRYGASEVQLRQLVLALPTFSNVRLLWLQHPRGDGPAQKIDTLPFERMPRLEALALDGFSEANLRGLPPSLRTLRVCGFVLHPVTPPAMDACRLPVGSSMASVVVTGQSHGIDEYGPPMEQGGLQRCFRVVLRDLARGCKELYVDAEAVLLNEGPGVDKPKWLDEDADVRPLLEALDYALNDMSYHTVAQHVLLPSNAVFIFRGRTGRMQAARGHALLRATKELCARLQFVVNETDGRQPLRWLLTDSGNGLLPREVRQWECQSTHSLLNIRRTYSSV